MTKEAEVNGLMERTFLQLTGERIRYKSSLGSNGKSAYWTNNHGILYDECLLAREWSNRQLDNKSYSGDPKGRVSSVRFTTIRNPNIRGPPILSTKIDSTWYKEKRDIRKLFSKVPEELEALRKYMEKRGSWLRRYLNALSQGSVGESQAQVVIDDRLFGISTDFSRARIRRNFGEHRSYEGTSLSLEFQSKDITLIQELIDEQQSHFSEVKV